MALKASVRSCFKITWLNLFIKISEQEQDKTIELEKLITYLIMRWGGLVWSSWAVTIIQVWLNSVMLDHFFPSVWYIKYTFLDLILWENLLDYFIKYKYWTVFLLNTDRDLLNFYWKEDFLVVVKLHMTHSRIRDSFQSQCVSKIPANLLMAPGAAL